MTAYSRAESKDNDYNVTVEIKGVNNRYKDVAVKSHGKYLSMLDEKVKKYILPQYNRGKIDIKIHMDMPNQSSIPMPDIELAKTYLKAIQDISSELKLKTSPGLSELLIFRDIIKTKDEEADIELVWNNIKATIDIAMNDFMAMRQKEGENLSLDIMTRLKTIESLSDKIKERAPIILDAYRKRLGLRIKEISETDPDPQRITMEVAIMAERSDITEELVRIISHLNQFMTITEENGAIGRKLDFLLQELNRETNTIASKSSDAKTSHMIVDMKSELERIREQIQNIE